MSYHLLVSSLHEFGIAECFVDITSVNYKSINPILQVMIGINVGFPASK